ncbi:MAG: prefoldin subunit beta [Thermoplasmata archaeon]|nr:prefoldin subunit beta [Thermoplasmata archaeon]
MSVEIPAKIQNQIAQYQQIQQQLQMITSQRVQISAQLEEVKSAQEDLEKLKKGTPVYRVTGSLLIKVTDLKELKKDLDEKNETSSIKVKSLERQEKQLKERFVSLQQEITQAMQGLGMSS